MLRRLAQRVRRTHRHRLAVAFAPSRLHAVVSRRHHCSRPSDKQSTLVLKEHVNVLAPYLTELFNLSLSVGVVPSNFKKAYVTPLLKKPGCELIRHQVDPPISNLPVLSKLRERLVARQLLDQVYRHNLLPDLQSAYRVHYSTETAVLKVVPDILRAADGGDV